MSEDLVKAHVRKWLAANVAVQEAFREKVREAEAFGLRIVDGGQNGTYDDDDRCDWEVTDWRTGEVVASGHGTYVEMTEALDRVGPLNRLQFVADLSEETELPDPGPADGLPESLGELLVEWLEDKADAEEVAAWLGEPVEVIERQMRHEAVAAREDMASAAE